MEKLLLGLLAAFLLVGCVGNQNRTSLTSNIEIDSVAIKDSLLKTNIANTEGNRAIGNIDFYISETEFKKQKEIFLKPLVHIINVGSAGSYTDGYNIGEYNFSTINGKFYNDSLFNVHISGDYIKYDNYDNKMPKQYNALISIFKEKYGVPNVLNDLPAWSNIAKNDARIIAEWHLGFKSILVWVACHGVYYDLNFAYYIPAMAKRKNDFEERASKELNSDASKIL